MATDATWCTVDDLRAPIQTSQLRYRGYEGLYNFERESLETARETQGETRNRAATGPGGRLVG